MNRLQALYRPESIAVIGATDDSNTAGYGLLKNLITGGVFENENAKPFRGRLYVVNPENDSVLNVRSYDSLDLISDTIDLAIITVKAAVAKEAVTMCIQKKVKSIMIISSGFSEEGKEKLQKEIGEMARKARIPLMGPNCSGIINPSANLNASFALTMPTEGRVALITQSGALMSKAINWMEENRFKFSSMTSYGNESDIKLHEYLEYVADNEQTEAIAIYVESIQEGRAFIETAQKIKKPIVLLKGGKYPSNLVQEHVGSVPSDYAIYQKAFDQANIIEVDSVEELFDLSRALAILPSCKENAIAVISNSGGIGILAVDACIQQGVKLVEFKKTTKVKLKKLPLKNISNPLDLSNDVTPEDFTFALNILLEEKYIAGVLVLQTLQTMTQIDVMVNAIIQAKEYGKPIITTSMAGKFNSRATSLLEVNDIPDFNDVKKAVKVFSALMRKEN